MGSGVLVSRGTDLFVATAHHVTEVPDPDDLHCIPKPPRPINMKGGRFSVIETDRKSVNHNENLSASARPGKMHLFSPETHAAIL